MTIHALEQASWRGIAPEEIWQVLEQPEQVIVLSSNRTVYQSRQTKENKVYLLRVFVETDVEPQKIVSTYRTSKVKKYWLR
ncbi:MAG: DUF4258 domain-containing protein [Fimbriimonadales bacterium]|nr:DUF4258 domain-containing protein [Fimbriimonadales bacterium]